MGLVAVAIPNIPARSAHINGHVYVVIMLGSPAERDGLEHNGVDDSRVNRYS